MISGEANIFDDSFKEYFKKLHIFFINVYFYIWGAVSVLKRNVLYLTGSWLILSLTGCATSQLLEVELFQKAPVRGSQVDVSAVFEEQGRPVEVKDCINMYLLFPERSSSDADRVLANVCSEDEQMVSAKLTEEVWSIGIYTRICHVTRAYCK